MQHSPSEGPENEPASVLPFDWPWDPGEVIWPCRGCQPWRAELFVMGPDDAIWVREWHAEDCRIWAEVEVAESGEPEGGHASLTVVAEAPSTSRPVTPPPPEP